MKAFHRICTHSGEFHADEVFAVAILTLYAKQWGVRSEIRRSRNPVDWEWADAVVDVGAKYLVPDADGRYWFDHHQREGAGARPSPSASHTTGVPYSACGLVWKAIGRDVLVGGGSADPDRLLLLDQVAGDIDRDLIAPIDATDNGEGIMEHGSRYGGIRNPSLPWIVDQFNPPWNNLSVGAEEERFGQALLFAQGVLKRTIEKTFAKHAAVDLVRSAYATRDTKEILVLAAGMPWKYALLGVLDDKEVHFVVHPGDGSTPWMISAVPSPNRDFTHRKLLPKSWAGLREAALDDVSGIAGTIFCHRDRFIAGARTFDQALLMAKAAVAA